MNAHPYSNLPKSSFWKRSVSLKNYFSVDPVISTKFKIDYNSRVGSGGSCFAQHISSWLKNIGVNYIIQENAHPMLSEEEVFSHNYTSYSARYGNIYTASQLLQLVQRAFTLKDLEKNIWSNNGVFFDGYRPNIQPNGYSSITEVIKDREYHLSCVRALFENLDIFIFTLGLTESWRSKEDGTTFPVCPHVITPNLDQDKFYCHNFNESEVRDDLVSFYSFISSFNSKIKFILSVSPVPMIATIGKDHILNANCYSKSVLRVAVQELLSTNKNIDYFPSFEIISTSPAYFGDDLRTINSFGIDHVMNIFKDHYILEDNLHYDKNITQAKNKNIIDSLDEICDEVIHDTK